MIRTLFTVLVAVVMSVGACTSQAYHIDNFSSLDAPNGGGGTAVSGDHGGAITAEVTSSTGVGVTSLHGIGVYSFNATPGDMLSVFYDWAGVFEDLPGQTYTSLFLDGIVPVDVLTGSLADWTMLVDAPGASNVLYTPAAHNIPAQLLTGATSLEFKFTYAGTGTSLIMFGGQDLQAVPEPNSNVLMLIGIIGVFIWTGRRR